MYLELAENLIEPKRTERIRSPRS